MSFIFSGIMLFLLCVPLWFIWRIANRVKTGKTKGWFFRELIYITFFGYVLVLFSLTLLPLYFDGSIIQRGSLYGNIIPIVNTVNDIKRNSESSFMSLFWLKNIVGNIIAFIPFGIMFPVVFTKYDSVKKTVLFGFILTLTIEVLQLLSSYAGISYRIFDIDDTILNVVGVCIGCFLQKGVQLLWGKFRPSTPPNIVSAADQNRCASRAAEEGR